MPWPPRVSALPAASRDAPGSPAGEPRKVALLVETSRAFGRGLCQGVARYAQENPRWSILYQERTLDQRVPEVVRRGAVDGILLRVHRPDLARQIRSLRIPTVDLIFEPGESGCPAYLIDDAAVGRLAAEHLLGQGHVRFACCGYPGIGFSDRRQESFCAAVARLGFGAGTFRAARPGGAPAARRRDIRRAEEAGYAELDALAGWLQALPKPVGLFACNDVRALQVLQAAQTGGVAVPAEVAVVGVDNDEILTQLAHPQLTSIQPDTQAIGYQACQGLERLMAGRARGELSAPRGQTELIKPLGIVERESTNFLAVPDRLVATAQGIIRVRAEQGLSVKDLLALLRVSRSSLEARFRAALGRTVHDEILRRRLQRVSQLLCSGDRPLAEIAARTGFLDVSHLSRCFKKQHGTSPGRYRAQARRPG